MHCTKQYIQTIIASAMTGGRPPSRCMELFRLGFRSCLATFRGHRTQKKSLGKRRTGMSRSDTVVFSFSFLIRVTTWQALPALGGNAGRNPPYSACRVICHEVIGPAQFPLDHSVGQSTPGLVVVQKTRVRVKTSSRWS